MKPFVPTPPAGSDLSAIVVRVPQHAPPEAVPSQAPPPELDARQAEELAIRLLGENLCRRLGVYRLPKGFVLSVVIPVYNELHTVEEVVRRVRTCGVPTEIILVDDGSTDGTRDLLESWRGQRDLRIILHQRNQGKGAPCGPASARPRATW